MKTHFLLIALLAAFALSCETIITVDIEDDHRMITFNSILSADSVMMLHLTRSNFILVDDSYQPLENANISVYEDDVLIEQPTYIANGLFKIDRYKPKIGSNYRFEIASEGLPSVSAQCNIPQPVQLISLDTIGEVDEYTFAFKIRFNDDAGVQQYYLLQLFLGYNQVYYDEFGQMYEHYVYSPVWLYSSDMISISDNSYSFGMCFSDQLFDGEEVTLNLRFENSSLYVADTAKFQFKLNSITRDMYLYLETRERYYSTNDDPFAERVQVYSNIENGVGILGATSCSVDSFTTIRQSDWWWKDK